MNELILLKDKQVPKRTNHGKWKHRLYNTWRAMLNRCHNKNDKDYKRYGNKNIEVCNEWLDINKFIEDMYPSFQEGLTLDRINVDGNYCKENCRWANAKTQSRNQRISINNTSGYRGVYWYKRRSKWIARISVDYKKIYLGLFSDKIDAAKAYDKYIIDNNLEHTRNFTD